MLILEGENWIICRKDFIYEIYFQIILSNERENKRARESDKNKYGKILITVDFRWWAYEHYFIILSTFCCLKFFYNKKGPLVILGILIVFVNLYHKDRII